HRPQPAGGRCDIGAFELTLCSLTPLFDCRKPTKPAKAVLVLKDGTPDAKDVLVWSWGSGAATAPVDFGDPLGGATDYRVCLYDASAAAQPVLIATATGGRTCAGKPCWKANKTGFKYKDKGETPDGILVALLKGGIDGKAKLVVKGKGVNLKTPTL